MPQFTEEQIRKHKIIYDTPIAMLRFLNIRVIADEIDHAQIDQIEDLLRKMEGGKELLDLYYPDPRQALIRIDSFLNSELTQEDIEDGIDPDAVKLIQKNLDKISKYRLECLAQEMYNPEKKNIQHKDNLTSTNAMPFIPERTQSLGFEPDIDKKFHFDISETNI